MILTDNNEIMKEVTRELSNLGGISHTQDGFSRLPGEPFLFIYDSGNSADQLISLLEGDFGSCDLSSAKSAMYQLCGGGMTMGDFSKLSAFIENAAGNCNPVLSGWKEENSKGEDELGTWILFKR